jgi:ABC-2 type transport system permease protein
MPNGSAARRYTLKNGNGVIAKVIDYGAILSELWVPDKNGRLGKGLGSGVKGIIQALTISVLALIMGVHLNFNPLAWVGVLVVILLGAVCFSTISLIIAALVRDRERVQGLGQLIMMPLFFASNALYPISIMPDYVSAIATANPLSYMVDALRELMTGTPSHYGLAVDFLVLLGVNALLVLLASRLYPRVVQ